LSSYANLHQERVDDMATKSILKNVDIKDPKLGKSLVVALESASNKKVKEVTLCQTYSDIHGEMILKIFRK
jgi:hypothetical protein